MNLFFDETIHPVNRERLNASKPESVLEAITLVPHMPCVGIELLLVHHTTGRAQFRKGCCVPCTLQCETCAGENPLQTT